MAESHSLCLLICDCHQAVVSYTVSPHPTFPLPVSPSYGSHLGYCATPCKNSCYYYRRAFSLLGDIQHWQMQCIVPRIVLEMNVKLFLHNSLTLWSNSSGRQFTFGWVLLSHCRREGRGRTERKVTLIHCLLQCPLHPVWQDQFNWTVWGFHAFMFLK